MIANADLASPRLTALRRITGEPAPFRADPPEEPVAFRGRGDFRDLFSLRAMDNLLSFWGRRRPDFRVIREGGQVPDSHYTRSTIMYSGLPDTRKITDELAGGSTLVLQGIQEYCEPLSEFTRRLAHDLSRPIHANAYVTPPKSQGFGSHFDPQDAFIVQVEGSKDWTLREPVLLRPLAHESWDHMRRQSGTDARRLEESAPWRELTLEPGDCLWLPRGWVHSARSAGATSLHLTLSLTTWTEHWAVLEWISRLGPGRAGLPAGFLADDDCATAEAARLRTALTSWFDQVSDAELAGILRRAALGEFPAPARQVSALLADDAITPELKFAVNAHTVFAAIARPGQLVLHLADRVITVPGDAAAVCAEILGREHFTVGEIGGSPPARADAVRLLWRAGVIERRPA